MPEGVEERHLQAADVALELLPLGGQAVGVLGVAFDEIADGEDELRLEEVQLLDGLGKDSRTMAAGAIADDGKAKLTGFVVQPQIGPGIAFLHLDLKSVPEAAPGCRDKPIAAARVPITTTPRSKRFMRSPRKTVGS